LSACLQGLGLLAVGIAGAACSIGAPGRIIARTETGGTILRGDEQATLARIRQACGGDFVIVGEREVITGPRGVGPDDDPPAAILILGLFASAEEESSLTTEWAYDYRCTSRPANLAEGGPATDPRARKAAARAPVVDTGLEWQAAVDDLPLTAEQARLYCERLAARGERPWRIPTVAELETQPPLEPGPRRLWSQQPGSPVVWSPAEAADSQNGAHAPVRCVR